MLTAASVPVQIIGVDEQLIEFGKFKFLIELIVVDFKIGVIKLNLIAELY
jgi:hypothetical protein